MNPELEIIIPVRDFNEGLVRTVASIAAQTDRQFNVLLSDAVSSGGANHLKSAEQELVAAGIPVRRIQATSGLAPLEHWNLAHSQAQSAWLKPLPTGSELRPTFVEAFRQRIVQRPQARLVRCDAEVRTEWGPQIVHAPFPQSAINPAEMLNYFPMKIRWLAATSNVAFHQGSWQSAGGYSTQFPGCAFLNLNVILALHHGLENIHETLVVIDPASELPVTDLARARPNLWLELWLIMRQARNYCLATKLPWSKKWLLPRGIRVTGR